MTRIETIPQWYSLMVGLMIKGFFILAVVSCVSGRDEDTKVTLLFGILLQLIHIGDIAMATYERKT